MAWGIAQSAKANGATSGTQSLAFSGSVTTGNILIVALRSEDSADPLPRPTDTQGNSYTLLGEAEAGIDPNTAVYGAVATANGVCTVSEDFVVGGGNWGMTLAEVSGGPGQVHFDVNGWVGASSGTSATVTATSATAVANTLAIGFFSLQRGLSGTLSVPPSGWTDINAQTTMTDGAFDLAYQVQSAAGSTPSATWSWTGSGSSTAIVITLRPDTQSNPKVITRAMGNTPASATTLTIPFPPTTAGTTPVIFVNPDSASVTSVIDSASNAWTPMTGSAGRLQGYYLLGSANTGGITSVTVTISPAKVVWGGTYLELSGIDATTPLRTLVFNNTFASGFTATTPGAAQSGDLVLAVGGGTAQLQSIDSSYVTMEWVGPSSNLLDAVKVASAATTQSATYGMGSADGLWYCVAVFAAAVAATAAQTAAYLPCSLVRKSSKWAIFRYYRPQVLTHQIVAWTPAAIETEIAADLTAVKKVLLRSNNETESVTGTPGRARGYSRQDTEAPSTLDSPSRLIAFLRSGLETVLSLETVQRLLTLGRTDTETTTGSDSISQPATRSRTTSDTTATPDQSNRLFGFIRSGLESLGSSDVVQGLRTLLRSSTETETETETETRQSGLSRHDDESAIVQDQSNRALSLFRSVLEALLTSDQVQGLRAIFRSSSDSTTETDIAARQAGMAREDDESEITADSPNRLVARLRAALETITTNAVFQRLLGMNRETTETETESDTATRRSELSREDDESSTVQDQPNRLIAMLRSALDTVQTLGSAAANLNHEITDWVVNAAETVLATGLVSRALSLGRTTTETTTGTDAANRQEGLSRTGDETEAISDTPSRLQALLRSITETIQATGTAVSDLQHSAVHWVASAAESVGLTDLANRLIAFSRTTPEATGETDNAARQEAISRTDSGQVSSRDTDDRQVGFQRSDAEQETASDAPERRHGLLAQVAEATGVTGALEHTTGLLRSLADAIGIGDQVAVLVRRLQSRGDIIATMEAPFRASGSIEAPATMTGDLIAPNRITGTMN